MMQWITHFILSNHLQIDASNYDIAYAIAFPRIHIGVKAGRITSYK